MLDRIVAKLIANNIRLDDERVKSAKFERQYKNYYAFRMEGKVYEFTAKEFTQAYWDRVNDATRTTMDLDGL